MPLEKGGRADKKGDQYETNCIIYEILKVLNEINYSVVVEALGTDEIGTDILITTFEGIKEHQQCKARNASKISWGISDLKAKDILSAWKIQLNRNDDRKVALVSPMECSFLVDLNDRAHNTSGKAEDFYNIQILESSKEFRKFYESFCKEMGVDIKKNEDVLKSIDYLQRIYYKRMSEYELQELINQSIQFLFISERSAVYNAFVSFVVTKDILGKEITQSMLYDYLKNQKIEFRLRDGDDRISPRIEEINYEYRETFKPLQGGLIDREEFNSCINAIEKEKPFIISGNAGYGKSGCTEEILNYCERKNIPYIAIKLDRRIPKGNCEKWGQELGLPGSVAYAIHCISKNEKAVIVLDQLDALRWTQANSSEAISICMELIRQVKYLNREREKKIIIVFVCRSYDLENDNHIGSLFKQEGSKESDWTIVNIGNFDENTVRKIIGEEYKNLSIKLKMLLSIPSNIYIWQHLEKEQSYSDCLTTSHLIENWFQQICRKSIAAGLHEKSVIEFYIQHGNFEKIISNVETLNEEQIKSVLEMAIPYMVSDEYRELAKTIILSCINSNIDLEFPVIQIFDKEYIKLEDDRTFLHEVMSSKISKRIVWLFVHYLEENALSIVDYTDIIIKLCENILQMEMDELWGIEEELSKLIISLYDETANSEKGTNKLIAEKCLDLWDIMFERQLGSVREISMKLMER